MADHTCFSQQPFSQNIRARPIRTTSSYHTIRNQRCGVGLRERQIPRTGQVHKFIKKYWDVLLGDIAVVVKYFERSGKIDPSCNLSFISLIPKIKDPQQLKDYRPISLIGCIYKIIAKILVVRIKNFMGQCIDEVQTAFVSGRNILDDPLLVNEIYTSSKK